MFSRRTTLLALTLAVVLSGAVTAGAKTLITGKQIKNNSITGTDIKNRSVKASDLSVGVAGSLVSFSTAESPAYSAPPDSQVYSIDATCPGGTTVTGTGFFVSIASLGFVRSYGSFVRMAFYNDTGVTATGLHVQAMCGSVSGASLRGVNSGGKAQADKDLARFKAAHAAS